MRKVIDEGDGYKIRATRKSIGTFEVVAVDWEHPNYGYFVDAMLWIRSPHLDKWTPVPIVNWARKYNTAESFLKDYPDFTELFEENNLAEVIMEEVCINLRQYLRAEK